MVFQALMRCNVGASNQEALENGGKNEMIIFSYHF